MKSLLLQRGKNREKKIGASETYFHSFCDSTPTHPLCAAEPAYRIHVYIGH